VTRRSLAGNIGALVGAQAVSLVVPLLTIPYLARTLRPEGWASVLVAQALGAWLVLLLEYGFDLSATRDVAQARQTPDVMRAVVAEVQGAKLLLVPVAALVGIVALVVVPGLRGEMRLLLWAVAFAVLRGLNPLWYFQGMERVRGAAAVDAGSKAAAALSVFLFVHRPADGWRVIALQAVFAGLSLALLTRLMAREVRMRIATPRDAWLALRRASGVFGVRAASGFSVQANTLVLAAISGGTTVSYFGGAERIVRASINLFQPLTQALLPRISFLSVADPARARVAIRKCLAFVGGLGALFGSVAFVAAPLLTRVLLGPGYDAVVPVLRVLAPLPLLVGIDTVLGLYWAVPFGHERAFLVAVAVGGAANIGFALLAVPRLGAAGMALAVVAAELTVSIALTVLYLRRRRSAPAAAVAVQ
jgi:Membrane protein involved in the export of O-antigen and teichoic acid